MREEAGALNGHDVPVKNDYTRHRRGAAQRSVLYKDRCQNGDTIDVLLAYGRGGNVSPDFLVRESHVLADRVGARYNNFRSRAASFARANRHISSHRVVTRYSIFQNVQINKRAYIAEGV